MEQTFTIQNPSGMHARPATNLVKKANTYPCEIKIIKGEEEIDAKNLISILGLGLKQGETITVITKGEQETEALAAISEIIKTVE
ncbi:HPr family phosphocarrier protein [Paenibacillus alkaliterrae]|uniref:HPr family phosphocarrier protein n=1 Tax=Paenibacillus alkaliterrae TaxID=320909 RepID=UPI001F238661|nr:HPr family phosphocarrier protein [Paenibacillus alkaliterrae]MCF2941620.1 HPr family phosphocarrier protein [Paenibacillus alkaliterrae]